MTGGAILEVRPAWKLDEAVSAFARALASKDEIRLELLHALDAASKPKMSPAYTTASEVNIRLQRAPDAVLLTYAREVARKTGRRR
jgi:hypothetical protein